MYSMTGYGKGIAQANGKRITIELKTVNHRFLDFNLKIPRAFLFLEDTIKKTVSSSIVRGHIDLFLIYEQTSVSSGEYVADIELAKDYLRVANMLAKQTGVKRDVKLSTLLKVPDIITRTQTVEDEDLLKSLTMEALGQAIENLRAMRNREGDTLRQDLLCKLDNISSCLQTIKTFAPLVVESYRNQMTARIQEVVEPSLVDAQRLATEIAIYADHCCIDEEITRLSIHIDNMRLLLDLSEPIGRKLDFLVQEMNRETNTIGSKANDMRITTQVLSIKNDIEKIREQSANVE